MKRRVELRASVAALICASSACWLACSSITGSEDSNNSVEPPPLPTGEDACRDNPLARDCDDTGGNDVPGAAGGDDEPAPEREIESSYRTPEVTGKYVWSANPESGRVAVIDAETFEVLSAEAGLGPTHVAAINPADGVPRALVINTATDDATLLTVSAGAIETSSAPLHLGADTWSVSPGGRFAVAWTDSRKAERLDPTDGFQDITVVEVPSSGAPVATRLTVGYRPSEIAFNALGNRAFTITEDGISVIDLTSGAVRLSGLVPLPSRIGLQPDVSITPDGTRALARIEGESTLFDIDLVLATTTPIELGGDLTDLDLSADGSRAVAVVRTRISGAAGPDAGTLADAGTADAGSDGGAAVPPATFRSSAVVIPLPGGLSNASLRQTFESPTETFGSVALSLDGEHAVLFTTARASSRVTLLGPDLAARTVDLLAAVRAVFVTADGAHAVVLQDPAAGSLRKGAFSVLSLANVRAPKLVASDAPTQAVALPPDSSDRALVTVSDPATNVFGSFLVRMPNLQVDFSGLPSRPLATGTVPSAGKAFVAQAHPEGRITFIDLADGRGREITGFELSSKVVDE